MLKQLMGSDHESFNLSEISDLIINNPIKVGSTVKVEDFVDPYSILALVDAGINRETECIKQLNSYILSKSSGNEKFQSKLKDILGDGKGVAYLFSERLLNMPPQTYPPMLNMMLEEIDEIKASGETSFDFTYFIMFSKVYREVASKIDEEGNDVQEPRKKAKLVIVLAFSNLTPRTVNCNTFTQRIKSWKSMRNSSRISVSASPRKNQIVKEHSRISGLIRVGNCC
jgi:protein BCP1